MEAPRTKESEVHKAARPITENKLAEESGIGPRTVTIGKSAYAVLTSAYEKNKVKLMERENIKTLTEYARARLLRAVEGDILEGRFEIVGRHDNTYANFTYQPIYRLQLIYLKMMNRLRDFPSRRTRSSNHF